MRSLTLALNEGEWSALRPGRLTPPPGKEPLVSLDRKLSGP